MHLHSHSVSKFSFMKSLYTYTCCGYRRAEREAEAKARDAERAQHELDTKGPPFSMEVMRCDQLAAWCKQYEKATVKEEAPKADVKAELDGMVALKKNDIEGEDDVFATSRSKSAHLLFSLVGQCGTLQVVALY